MALATACTARSTPATPAEPLAPAAAAPSAPRPVVEVAPRIAALPPLDPSAEPRTALGELRSRYLPIWSPDFDWAFPPEVCGSDWPLDAIAEPTSAGNLGVLGDAPAAAALSVMRYEHLLSGALAGPDVLGQLCVAVATVSSARGDALERLAAYLATGARNAEPPAHPEEVTIVAVNPTAALATACVTPGYPRVVTGDSEAVGDPPAPARLSAYLLTVSRGLEDAVTDISYRVSDITHRPAEDCGERESWAAEWDRQAGEWAAQGQLWAAAGRTVTVGQLCHAPSPDGPDECPREWSS